MPTFHSKQIIDELIANDGVYPGDPQCHAIFEYKHDTGQILWEVDYDGRGILRLAESPYVLNFRCLWTAKGGLIFDPQWIYSS